jgi:ankyrin repeat protein
MAGKQPKHKPRPGVDEYGRTDLHHAALNGDAERVRQLFADSSNPNATDDNGYTPLHFAAQERHLAIVVALLEAGADPNIVDVHGNGPLWKAVINARGDHRIVELLIRAGAEAQYKNRHGRSPYDMASTIGYSLGRPFVEGDPA